MSDPLTLTSLPLFPLNTVLFPGGVLPLRVFEVRYLDMVRKCHRAGAPFGVVALARGHEVRQAGALPESLYSVGTLAMIEHLEELQAGLMHVRCRGIARFRIVRQQLLPHGLWTANVEQIPCDTPVQVPPDLQRAASTLTQVLSSLREQAAGAAGGPAAHAQPSRTDLQDCGWLANRWCELLPIPLELKQQLMQLDNPLVRLELVSDILERTGISG
ncbi:peptidase S16, lon domain protein [Acidovorax sp. JS42]|nr:peptidase S16, lon domain protein [Acidovorax sp. JS42]